MPRSHLLMTALLLAAPVLARAATIVSVTFENPGPTITTTDFVTPNDNEHFNANTGGSNPLALSTLTVSGGQVYDILDLPFDIELRRSDPSNDLATIQALIDGGNGSSSNPYNLVGQLPDTMEEAYNSRNLAAGVENMFINTDATFNKSVERVDYVYQPGIKLQLGEAPVDYGFGFFERFANNKFGIAAITGIDASGNPTSYGDLVMFGDGTTLDYGNPDLTPYDDTARFLGTIADPYQEVDNGIIGNQNIGGVFITFDDLNVAASDTIYGYSLFAGDQDSKNGGNAPSGANINAFGNDSVYEQSTNSTNGGGDLYGGGVIFQSNGSSGGSPLLPPGAVYWDKNGATVGAGTGAALSDVWTNNINDDYWGGRDGDIPTFGWVADSRAIFSAGTSATGETYTVTVGAGETVEARGIRVEEGTLTLASGDAASNIQLNQINGETPEIDVQDGLTTTISTSLTGTEGFDFRDTVSDAGNSQLILTGDNTISGTATVEEGTLELAGTGSNESLGNIDEIVMEGGTLLLSASDQVNDSADVTLDGGNITVSDNFDHEDTMGTLTLSDSATIDFGSRATNDQSILRFADSTGQTWAMGEILTIVNWSGNYSPNGQIGVKDPNATGGGGQDQLFFGSDLNGLSLSQISQIRFVDPAGLAPGTYEAIILSTGEIVPVPEPATVLTAALLLGFAFWTERRRRRQSA